MYSARRSSTALAFRVRAGIAASIALVALLGFATSAFAATFNPNLVVSNDNMRAYDCMSQKDIQAFLNTQTGPLKSLVTTDHVGVKKPAAQIIYEACRQWHISPRVMLVMLQKEQSLLTRTSLTKSTLTRAIGAGCPNKTTNKYPGFGNQMWNGAKLLDGYGEGKNGSKIALWASPYKVVTDIYASPQVDVKTANLATYKLYIYNPSVGAKKPYGDLSSQASNLSGNANFWHLYWRYFGDPLGNPQVRPVYRFVNKSNGGWFYTSSELERYKMVSRSTKTWQYKGVAFRWDTTTTPSPTQTVNTASMYRFYNRKTGKYLYTSSTAKLKSVRSAAGKKIYRSDGVAWRFSKVSTMTVTVYRFWDTKSKTYLLTSSAKEKATYLSAARRKQYHYAGSFYVAY